MKLFEPNGCGPKGLQRVIPDGPFHIACDIHDTHFNTLQGYWRSNYTFLVNMLACSCKWYHYPWAVLYFSAVLLFGWIWYIPKKIKRRL